MKSALLGLFLIVLAFKSFAGVDNDSNLTNQAFEVLIKNVDTITLEGDIKPGEKLKPILDELGDFIGSKIFSIMGGDSEDYTGLIRDFSADCSPATEQNLSTKCKLVIQYKSQDVAVLTFNVDLHENKIPKNIVGNRVQVSRGD